MNQDVIKVLEFLKNPGYVKKGKYWIANKLGVNVEAVKEAKRLRDMDVSDQQVSLRQLANSIKLPTKSVPSNIPIPIYEESSRTVDNVLGKITSVVITDFEPKDDIEIADLHKIDLTKYRIDSYYSKRSFSGKFALFFQN